MSTRRNVWLLTFLLVAQLLLLGGQVPEGGTDRTLLEGSALRLAAPLTRFVDGAGDLVGRTAHGFELRRSLLEENRRLTERVESLEREKIRFLGLESELERLRQTIDYTPPGTGESILADIVYSDHTSWLQTVFLYVGQSEVDVNQPVVAGDGLVGRVVVVAHPYAKVQLITDRAASIGAMIARTRRQGVVRGSGRGTLEMNFVPLQADVAVGDTVLSAGIDGVFPRGLPIGTVTAVEPGDELFHRVVLRPAVDFGEIDQVFVLSRESIPPELASEEVDARP